MVFSISFEVKGHIGAHWKSLSSGKCEPRGFTFSSTPSFCQEVLNGANLLHKWCIVDSQTNTSGLTEEVVILTEIWSGIIFHISPSTLPSMSS